MLLKQITVYNGPFQLNLGENIVHILINCFSSVFWCCLRANNNVDEWERIYIRTTEALNVKDRLQCYLQNTKHITLQRIKFFNIYTVPISQS